MKTVMFCSLGVVALLLVGWQHHQLGRLNIESAALAQSSAEAERLRGDLAKTEDVGALDAQEMDRLREENRDLLKLRNEVNQLREVKVQFEKVSAENQRLKAQPRNAPLSGAADTLPQPIVINVDTLSNCGLDTPQAACQTFFWAVREHNTEALGRCVVPESRPQAGIYGQGDGFKDVVSMKIVARRELDADTVQLGILIRIPNNSESPIRYVMKLSRKDGEWRLDLKNPF